MHQADEQVVTPRLEMRNAARLVFHRGSDPCQRNARPHQKNQHLDVEIHAIARPVLLQKLQDRTQRVDAETAHAVADLAGARIDRGPEIGQLAPIQARTRCVVSVDRFGAHHHLGLRTGHLQQAGCVTQRVLGISTWS